MSLHNWWRLCSRQPYPGAKFSPPPETTKPFLFISKRCRDFAQIQLCCAWLQAKQPEHMTRLVLADPETQNAKCQAFAGSNFLNVRICCFWV